MSQSQEPSALREALNEVRRIVERLRTKNINSPDDEVRRQAISECFDDLTRSTAHGLFGPISGCECRVCRPAPSESEAVRAAMVEALNNAKGLCEWLIAEGWMPESGRARTTLAIVTAALPPSSGGEAKNFRTEGATSGEQTQENGGTLTPVTRPACSPSASESAPDSSEVEAASGEIAKRLEGIMPGPWTACAHGSESPEVFAPHPFVDSKGVASLLMAFWPGHTKEQEPEAEELIYRTLDFIARAPEDIRHLLANNSSLAAALRRAREELAEARASEKQLRGLIDRSSWGGYTEKLEARAEKAEQDLADTKADRLEWMERFGKSEADLKEAKTKKGEKGSAFWKPRALKAESLLAETLARKGEDFKALLERLAKAEARVAELEKGSDEQKM